MFGQQTKKFICSKYGVSFRRSCVQCNENTLCHCPMSCLTQFYCYISVKVKSLPLLVQFLPVCAYSALPALVHRWQQMQLQTITAPHKQTTVQLFSVKCTQYNYHLSVFASCFWAVSLFWLFKQVPFETLTNPPQLPKIAASYRWGKHVTPSLDKYPEPKATQRLQDGALQSLLPLQKNFNSAFLQANFLIKFDEKIILKTELHISHYIV